MRLLSALVFLSVLASNVFAAQCMSQSPDYVNLGDDYFSLDGLTELTEKQKKKLSALMKPLVKRKHKREGTVEITVCRGAASDPVMDVNTYPAEIAVEESGKRGYKIRIKYESDSGRETREVYQVFATDKYHAFNIEGSLVDAVEKNYVRLQENQEIHPESYTGTTQIVEQRIAIDFSGNQKVIAIDFYRVGIFVGSIKLIF